MLNVGIAGFGKMGRIRANELLKNSETRLVAVFEQGESHTKGYEGVVFCETFEALINMNLDALFICAYNNALAEYTVAALEKGLHVFCEKPPAKNTTELKKVLDAEQKSKKVLKYGFNHRFHYSVMQAHNLIQTGSMGKMLWMRGIYGKAGSIDYHKNWRNYKKYSGGGILLDQGIHMLDLMQYFGNADFDVLSSELSTSYWDIEVEDNAFITLKNKSGVIATLHSSATQWKHKFLLEMCFEEGFITLDGILSATRSYAPESMIVGRREFEDITFAMGKPAEQITWFENDDSWKFELDEFLGCIYNDLPVIHGKSQDAYKILKLIETIYDKSGFYQ